MPVLDSQESRPAASALFSEGMLLGVLLIMAVLAAPASALIDGMPDSAEIFSEEELSWLDQHPVFRVAGPQAFPPFYFRDPDGHVIGMAADYMTIIASVLQVRFDNLEKKPWPQVLQGAREKTVDVIACSAKTADRSVFLLFSNPYLSFPLVIITRKDAPFVGGLEDLHGKILSVMPGNATQEWLRRDSIEIRAWQSSTPYDALKAVATGRADAHIENLAAASYIIQQQGLTNLKVAAPTSYGNYNLYIAVRNDWPELIPILNKVLGAIPPETHTAIRNTWLAVRYEHGIDAVTVGVWGLLVIGLSLVGFLGFFFWNRSLKREIIERQKAEKALADQESTMRSIFRAAPTGIGMTVDRVITRVNDKLIDMIGYDRDELVGKNARILYPSDEDYDLVGKDKYEQILKTGTGTVETHWVHKDGTVMDVILSSTPLDPDDLSRGVTFTALDVTDRKQLEERLRQSSKMEAVGTLSGGIAHDFNNILAIILGNTELARLNVPENSKADRYLGEVVTASLRAKDLVGQLLTFSRKSESRHRPIDISPIVKESLKMLRATIAAGIEFDTVISGPLPAVMADPTQIHQIMINLCTNAADAMDHDNGLLNVELTTVSFGRDDVLAYPDLHEGDYVRLAVRDTGKGIPVEAMERIFDPYFTTKAVGKGTGLGLAVTHGIVKNHNGAIWVNSREGKGTSVEVFFPVVGDQAPEVPDGKTRSVPPAGTGRILFVDDERAMVTLFEHRLAKLGYEVTGTTDPVAALGLFRKDPHGMDVIITDMTMPGMSGAALIREVLSIRPDIPAILCTGYSETMTEESALALGVFRYLEKPIAMDTLATAIQEAMAVSGSWPV